MKSFTLRSDTFTLNLNFILTTFQVGSGVYLASENGKSAGYVTAQGHTGVMFLCEAALGEPRLITRDGMVGWNEKDPVSAHNCHSCHAIGRTEPDPSKDTTFKYDGVDVTVPQGNVRAWLRARASPQYSSLSFLGLLVLGVEFPSQHTQHTLTPDTHNAVNPFSFFLFLPMIHL